MYTYIYIYIYIYVYCCYMFAIFVLYVFFMFAICSGHEREQNRQHAGTVRHLGNWSVVITHPCLVVIQKRHDVQAKQGINRASIGASTGHQ